MDGCADSVNRICGWNSGSKAVDSINRIRVADLVIESVNSINRTFGVELSDVL